MPNPYHDEAGRFSSKEEMGQAVDRLYSAMTSASNPVEQEEASNAWFNLRSEYEAAQKQEQAGAVGSFIHDNAAAKHAGGPGRALLIETDTVGVAELEPARTTAAHTVSKNAGEIFREEYEKIKASGDFENLNEHQARTVAKLFTSSKAPQDLRENFFITASASSKVAVMKRYLGHPLDGVRVSADMARGLLANRGEEDARIVSYALSSELPFSEKAALADNHGRLAYLAARDPHAFTDRADDPEVEQALIAELRRGARNGLVVVDEQRGGWQALALGSKLRSTRDEIIEKFAGYSNYDRRVVEELAQNQHLNSEQEAQILQAAAWNDAAHFFEVSNRIAGAAYKIKNAERKAHSERLGGIAKRYSEIMDGADTAAYVALTPSQARSSKDELERLNAIEAPTFQEQKRRENLGAVFDAQPQAYAALQRQVAENEASLKKNYVEREYFANERLRRTLRAATAVRAADIAAGEYVDQYYSA